MGRVGLLLYVLHSLREFGNKVIVLILKAVKRLDNIFYHCNAFGEPAALTLDPV